MFHKILVATDGREGGLDAAALARQLMAADGELLLAHIHHGYLVSAREQTGDYERRARADAATLLEYGTELTGIQSTAAHAAPSVGRGLRELAERESADLVVIGATRRAPIANFFTGDATRETLWHAHGAVAVAPVGYATGAHAISTVGLAYDASHESRAAAAVASDLAGSLAATLSAIEVLDIPMYLAYSDRGLPDRDAFEAAADEISKLGEFEPRVSFGYVGEQLAEATGQVDLLVMGSRSLGVVSKLLHSSRSQALASRTRCPLLILPEPASDAYQRRGAASHAAPVQS